MAAQINVRKWVSGADFCTNRSAIVSVGWDDKSNKYNTVKRNKKESFIQSNPLQSCRPIQDILCTCI